MNFYEIDINYLQYLHDNIDDKVLIHNIDKHTRKFIAVKTLINGCEYYVPLSSPDSKDYVLQDGKKTIRKSKVPTILRFFNKTNNERKFIGKLLFNNMLPVKSIYVKRYDASLESDEKYKKLVQSQIIVLSHKTIQAEIEKRAKLVHKLKLSNSNYGYIKSTVDFSKLEQEYRK